jgi:hypothetical protein
MYRSILLALALLVYAPCSLSAQARTDSVIARDRFWREAGGASLGSLLGIGAVIGADALSPTGAAGSVGYVVTTAGASSGLYLSRRAGFSANELIYGVMGAFVGAYAAHHVIGFASEVEYPNRVPLAMISYSVTQGLFTAAGVQLSRALDHK